MTANTKTAERRLEAAKYVKTKARPGCGTCRYSSPLAWAATYVHCDPTNANVLVGGICPKYGEKRK